MTPHLTIEARRRASVLRACAAVPGGLLTTVCAAAIVAACLPTPLDAQSAARGAPSSAIPAATAPKAIAGTVAGTVTVQGAPVRGATVIVVSSGVQTRTDEQGAYRIHNIPVGAQQLRVRTLGYRPDSARVVVVDGYVTRHDVALTVESSALQRVVVTGTLKPVTIAESPVKVEVVSTQFFARNVTNTVMEALKTVNGVQTQQDCGVCGTNNLRINGMEGPYTAVLIDGAPIMGSLASVYALNGINPALIEQIEIIKGPASTLYGTEAMGGVVNVITKDPRFAPKATVNVFNTSHGEWNADGATAGGSGRANFLLSASASGAGRFVDDNRDGFNDLQRYTRLALFGKFAVGAPNDRVMQVALKQYHETRLGGVNLSTTGQRCSAINYGESIRTERTELVGSYRLPTKARNMNANFSVTDHHQDSCYGTTRYLAAQQVAFGQLVWDSHLGRRHDVLAGATVRYQGYDDNTSVTTLSSATDTSNAPERRIIPGLFAQDEFQLTDRITLLGGIRTDLHREHGVIVSPRLALKYEIDPRQTIRLNSATGFRAVNIFSEDHAAISGFRRLVIRGPLRPERSLNASVNYNHRVGDLENPATFDIDLFATYFTNKIQPDYTTDPASTIYANLDGHAVSRGLSVSIDRTFEHIPIAASLGATIADVYIMRSGVARAQEFSPRFTGVFALSYTVPGANITVDYTGRVVGPMTLPPCVDTHGVACANIPTRSPWFSEQHVQFTRTVSRGLDLIASVRNALNVVVQRPVFDARRPFDSDFQTNFVYGPVEGRRVQIGARYVRARQE